MAATNFQTANNTFRKLIGNGLTYRIPRFQRDYSWTEDEWEDLWRDILASMESEDISSHYMGYLVLQSDDDRTFDVIDGQQRLTTISLIVLAILKNIQRLIDSGNESEANTQRMNQIRQTYIGYLDPVTLIPRSKLTLNRNNNNYFQTFLVPLAHLPQKGLRASENSLRKAFEWFDKRVAAYLKMSTGDEGKRLAKFVEDMSDCLFFTVITVTDELNAYKVFETLNARGVRLSATDLLKNYLFSILDRGSDETDHELRELERRWERIIERLQSEKFPDFLRAHWNSRHSLSRQADLFKTIRAKITSREAVFQLLRNMEEDLDAYLTLSSPEPSEWSVDDRKLAGVLKIFRVRQQYPLLLSARRALDAADFTGLLRAAVVIAFRYNVICAYGTAEQERVYNAVAIRIAKGELGSLAPVLQAMRGIYVADKPFRAAFSEKSIGTKDARNNRVVRFILCALEKHLTGQDHDFPSDAFGIEHVLPQNADDGWGGFTNEEADSMVYRLGNMTLLETGINHDAGTAEYAAKRDRYLQSGFSITKKLGNDNAEWTPERIASWQNWMATQAASIWRIEQLS